MQPAILSIFKKLKADSKNIVMSPLGLELAMTLIAEGTTGTVRKEPTTIAWGPVIFKEEFLKIMETPIENFVPTEEEIRKKENALYLRKLRPNLFNISIRGRIYLGLIGLNLIAKQENVISSNLKKWIVDLVDFLINKDIPTYHSIVKLEFRTWEIDTLTGYHSPFPFNPYFTKSEMELFLSNHESSKFLFKYLHNVLIEYRGWKTNNEEGFYFGYGFNSLSSFIEKLLVIGIKLPNEDLLYQFPMSEEDILGDVIEVDYQLIENLLI